LGGVRTGCVPSGAGGSLHAADVECLVNTPRQAVRDGVVNRHPHGLRSVGIRQAGHCEANRAAFSLRTPQSPTLRTRFAAVSHTATSVSCPRAASSCLYRCCTFVPPIRVLRLSWRERETVLHALSRQLRPDSPRMQGSTARVSRFATPASSAPTPRGCKPLGWSRMGTRSPCPILDAPAMVLRASESDSETR
jgi:hypothetical protein